MAGQKNNLGGFMMERIIQKGSYALLIKEKLSDGSFVYNVRILSELASVDLLAKDEEAAQRLFNVIEETCVGTF